jgi:hypothetical protein
MLLLVRCGLYVQEEPAALFPTPKRLKSYPSDQNSTEPSRRQLQGRLAGLTPRGRFRMPANTPGVRHPQRSPGFFFFPFPRSEIRVLSDAELVFVYIEKKTVLRFRDVYPGSRVRIISIPDRIFPIPDPGSP